MVGRLPHFAVLLNLVLASSLVAQTTEAPSPASAAIQLAMRQARDFLQQNRAADAVAVLETQLKNSSNAPLLALLKEAYATHVKDLELAGKAEAADMYRKRLQVLEATPAPAPLAPIARGSRPEEDPFQQRPLVGSNNDALRRAEDAFNRKQYTEAADLFSQAAQSQPLSPAQQSQFAYCRLSKVVARMNESAVDAANLAQLESEVNSALKSVNQEEKLDRFGQQVLEEIRKRRGSAAPTGFRHYERSPEGWLRCDSTNFHVYHMQTQEYAEQFLQLAEQQRKASFQKWAGAPSTTWTTACDVIIHTTAADYARVTKQPARSPGHSSFKVDGGAVLARRMDLRADEPNMLGCTLPHELTHLVIADLLSNITIPRWADEGMAVLSEPRAQLDRYGKTLQRLHSENALLPFDKMLRSPEFPEATHITAFYVESVSIVEFLVNERGPAVFLQFLRDAGAAIDPALQKHYHIRNLSELQERWSRVAFAK